MPLVAVDLQVIPTMRLKDLSSLISDSGITRYHLEAKVYDLFSVNVEEPYKYFPEGIHIERFDSLFQVEGSIVADTAYHFEKKNLWHAIGNVVAKNMQGRTFETSELFWDTKVPPNTVGALYTHQFVKITEPDGTYIDGINGFVADQSLNIVRLYGNAGNFFIEETDEQATDTLLQSSVDIDSISLHE